MPFEVIRTIFVTKFLPRLDVLIMFILLNILPNLMISSNFVKHFYFRIH